MGNTINYFSMSSQFITEAAARRGYGFHVLLPEKNLYTVTRGDKTVLFKSSDFGYDTALGHKLADDKELMYLILAPHGFPLIPSIYLSRAEAETLDTEHLPFDYPIVTKPTDCAHGHGVMTNIRDAEGIREGVAYALHYSESGRIVLQRHISGDEYRVYVIGDRIASVIHRIPPRVVGNGIDTLGRLIERENASPERGNGYHMALSKILIDAELQNYLRTQGYSLDSVPTDGISVQVRGNSNIGTGGGYEDVTDIMCDAIKDTCIRAAQILGLHGFSGMDVLSSDISRPLEETGGVLIECNNNAGVATPREAEAILDCIFGEATPTR